MPATRNISYNRGQFVAFSFFLLMFLFLPDYALALSISPPRQTVVIDPGKSSAVELTMQNDTKANISIQPDIDAFRIDPDTGRAVFGSADAAKQWITWKADAVALAPGEKKTITFSIVVPAEAEPGGHYLGLLAKAGGNGAVGLSSRAGSLLFLYVGGRAEESLAKKLFFSDHAWYWSLPLHFFLSLENTGNIHVLPEGGLVIANMRGERILTQPINPERKKLLPHGTWRETYTIHGLSWRDTGPLTATVFVQYGVTRQQMVDTISFWYVPIWLAAPGLIIFLLLFFLWWQFRKRKKQSAGFL